MPATYSSEASCKTASRRVREPSGNCLPLLVESPDVEQLTEAALGGELSPDKLAAYEEAVRRGLIVPAIPVDRI